MSMYYPRGREHRKPSSLFSFNVPDLDGISEFGNLRSKLVDTRDNLQAKWGGKESIAALSKGKV